MGWPEFSVDEQGTFFTVLMFDDYVIKVRRRVKRDAKKRKNTVRDFVETQNALAEKLPEVLPCEMVDDCCIVMPRVYGIRGDRLKRPHKKTVENMIRSLEERIDALGYKAQDVNLGNVIYQPESKKLYLIDTHRIEEG